MSIRRETVSHVAHLSRLQLTEEEVGRFQGQLSRIIEYIDQLGALDTENVAPMSQVKNLENVMRDDRRAASLPPETAVGNSPESGDNTFRVPSVL